MICRGIVNNFTTFNEFVSHFGVCLHEVIKVLILDYMPLMSLFFTPTMRKFPIIFYDIAKCNIRGLNNNSHFTHWKPNGKKNK